MEVISIVGVGVLGGRVGLRVEEGAGWPPSGGLAPSLLGNDGIEGNCALVGKVLESSYKYEKESCYCCQQRVH